MQGERSSTVNLVFHWVYFYIRDLLVGSPGARPSRPLSLPLALLEPIFSGAERPLRALRAGRGEGWLWDPAAPCFVLPR